MDTRAQFKNVVDQCTADGVTCTAEDFDSDFPEFMPPADSGMADAVTDFDGTNMAITIGSTAVDYTNKVNGTIRPIFKGAIGMGGRGISIYEPTDSGLTLIWDSADQGEREQCARFPWAHNSIMDEEFAPLNGVLYNVSVAGLLACNTSPCTAAKVKKAIEELSDPNEDGVSDQGDGTAGPPSLEDGVDERSLKDGAGMEAVVTGVACGRLLAVSATEKAGTAFVWDITVPASPQLLIVHQLTAGARTVSPGLAYAARTLGDIDPESIVFLEGNQSPTGNAAVLFAGAWSGTLSLYEFVDRDGNKCTTPLPPPSPPLPPSPMVQLIVKANGDVSDYGDARKLKIASAIAAELVYKGVVVAKHDIIVEVTAGSVTITISIPVASESAASSLNVDLAADPAFSTASGLSTVLAGAGVTATSDPTFSVTSPDSNGNMGLVVGLGIGSVAILGLVGWAWCKMSGGSQTQKSSTM